MSIYAFFYASEQAIAWIMWANSTDHLSQLPHFPPHPGGGGEPLNRAKVPFTANIQSLIRRLLPSQASEHFLPELKDVAFCM